MKKLLQPEVNTFKNYISIENLINKSVVNFTDSPFFNYDWKLAFKVLAAKVNFFFNKVLYIWPVLWSNCKCSMVLHGAAWCFLVSIGIKGKNGLMLILLTYRKKKEESKQRLQNDDKRRFVKLIFYVFFR